MSGRWVPILATTAAMMLVHAAHSGDPPEYEVEVIGYPLATGLGINDLGHICGRQVNADDEPFFWSPETGWVLLDIPAGFSEGRAQDLNSAGEIVGFLRLNVRPQAILWYEDQVVELGVPPGGDSSDALAINSQSQVVGHWGNLLMGSSPLAFIWQDGVITDLTPDLGPPKSIAYDINDVGMVTGWMGTNENTDAHAFIWDNGKVTDLGVIPGGFTGGGMAINNLGDVAVQGRMFDDQDEVIIRSFLWRDGEWIDLGVLPGSEETRVLDLNDAGQAIGYCEGLEYHRFLWQDGVMWELNDISESDDPEFLGIGRVYAINNPAEIAGSGSHLEFSSPAIRLTPAVPPLGDLDGDGTVGASDLLILLVSWGPCGDCKDCPADLDDDCNVGAGDLLILLVNWESSADLGDQLFELLADDGAALDGFSISVAISGGTAIVGAPGDDDNGGGSGSAYLFDTITGRQLFKLMPDDGAAGDGFGVPVAISGATAIVGVPSDNDNGDNSGAAYLFDTATGRQLFKLLADDGGPGSDRFGTSVAISGATAIVGAPYDNDNQDSGSAYLFDTTTGRQIAKLLPSDGAEFDWFGSSVAIIGATAIVGAKYDDDNGSFSGSAYLFDTSDPANPTQIVKLLPDDGAAADYFGSSVEISGATAIVGASGNDDNGFASGSAYLFATTTGQQLFKLLPDDGASDDLFGRSVAISGATAIVGAPRHGDNGTWSGSAYLFDAPGTPGTCPWDLDGSAVVGAADLLALLVSWGPCRGCPADFDGDGSVGATDLLALLVNWGPCP